MSVFAPVLLLATFVAAAGLTGLLRRYARRSRLLDVPNARSSHVVATPRGGGLAIVIATLGAFVVLFATGRLDRDEFSALAGAGLLVAAVGFADDRRGLAVHWRLAGHFVAAGWMLFWIGGPPPLAVFGHAVSLGVVGSLAAALYMVWILNLTNFMDGIDGIAAVEVITVTAAGAALYAIGGLGTRPALATLVMAAAALGFLLWNWPPASIFMGDSGSGFVGLLLAFFSLEAGRLDPRLFWCWLILLGVFIADATVTLLGRLLRRQRLYEAHRSHAYQHAARRWGHRPVTIGAVLTNGCWLTPIALLVAVGRLDGVTGTAIAYAPLICAALWMQAGRDTI